MNSRLFALVAALALVAAQGGAQAQPAPSLSQQQLDQMLAPIALYPDALLSQILLAATYPMEVIEAARWARDRPDLAGEAAVRAAAAENWDPSVKSLIAFPQVLARMAENLQWTLALGDAFLDRQSEVMDTVQALRRKAHAAGNLSSDARMSVVESGPSLLLQPVDPQIVYVPDYDPLVVYGDWRWPAYPPVYLRPWPAHHTRPAYAGGLYWGAPVGISAGFFFGAIDWRRREVKVVQVNHFHYRHPMTVRPAQASPPATAIRPYAWHHDHDRRRSPADRGVEAERRFGAAGAPLHRGDQARAADAHRFDRSVNARPNARFEMRRHAHSGPVRLHPESHSNQPVARIAPIPRVEAPRVHQPRMEIRPAPARQEPAAKAVARARMSP